MINVTKTYLPPIDTYNAVLKRAWDKAWITNNGELVQELEAKLKDYLKVKHLFFCNNGTIVLQMALKVYNITKEVITTPFSYVATTNSILWENCTPVFVDIEPRTFCIDADKIENSITEHTQAILATHVYGFPCDVDKIRKIADKHNLKVIYDGAHAFGCVYNRRPLLSYGDISTCSFHATKIFHTVEGGCIITNDDAVAKQLMLYRQFGHVMDDYYSIGINGKNSEFHAAMGLCVLPEIKNIIEKRRDIIEFYNTNLPGVYAAKDAELKQFEYNYSYYPVLFQSEEQLLKIKEILLKNEINTRRYFFPSLHELPYLERKDSCPVSSDISRRILCLPSYHDLSELDQMKICTIIKNSINN